MTSILHYMSPACAADSLAAQVVTVSQETKCDLIAAVIILEAGGEGENGMRAVSEVIHNRAIATQKKQLKQGKYIDVVDAQYAVIVAKKQFSCLNEVSAAQAITKARKHKHFSFAEKLVFDTMAEDVSNLTKGANHYCRFDCFPKWRDDKKMTVRIGDHVFFKL